MKEINLKANLKVGLALIGLLFQTAAQGSDLAITSIEQRERSLQEREQAIKDQLLRHEKTIQDLRASLEKERAENDQKMRTHEANWKKKLQDMEKELKSKTQELESSKERQLASFLVVYEKMEPKQAAKVLESADVKLATQIITQMKAQRAAEVLGKMNPEKARMITEAGFVNQKKTISQKVNEVNENNPIAPIGETEKN